MKKTPSKKSVKKQSKKTTFEKRSETIHKEIEALEKKYNVRFIVFGARLGDGIVAGFNGSNEEVVSTLIRLNHEVVGSL